MKSSYKEGGLVEEEWSTQIFNEPYSKIKLKKKKKKIDGVVKADVGLIQY